MGAIDYLALLERAGKNTPDADCTNCTKPFTQFMQSRDQAQKGAVTVARIATVAVASPMEAKTANAATQAEAAELRQLITSCATELVDAGRTVEGYGLRRTGYRDGWTAVEVEEALRVALADVDAALTCWRLLAPVNADEADQRN